MFIDAGEQGLLEHLGKRVETRSPLGPGAHLKWPWPIDKVYRFRTEQIQTFHVGFAEEEGHERERFVLWSQGHRDETNFLVANRVQYSQEVTNEVSGRRTPPVSLLTVSVPVQFQITNLVDWAYNNEDAPALLEDLGTREVVRYLVGVDMAEIMSYGRQEAAQALRDRIQAAANEHGLGAQIVSVGLGDLHPPVKVAPEYEKVIAANQTKQAKILAARADDIRTNALAVAQAVTLTNRASAERLAREVGALAQAALFTNQIPAFETAPSVYAGAGLPPDLCPGHRQRAQVCFTHHQHARRPHVRPAGIRRAKPAQPECAGAQNQIVAMKRNPLTLIIGLLLTPDLRLPAVLFPGPHHRSGRGHDLRQPDAPDYRAEPVFQVALAHPEGVDLRPAGAELRGPAHRRPDAATASTC